MPPTVSLVIPVLRDTEAAAVLLTSLTPSSEMEMIVVDGASDPSLESEAAARGAVYQQAAAGRGRQMNAGAAVATGEWLLFLHADSTLPPGWLQAITRLDDTIIGGWFGFALDDPAWQARVIERLTAWRVARLRLPYGDQGVFVRRGTFRALGGFRDLPLMEDVDFVRRLLHAGPVAQLPLRVRTSARRWKRDGWFRRSTKNLVLVSLYFLGVDVERLARWYPTRRST
jgi:rSAM/selenodomain-associated transferase 2